MVERLCLMNFKMLCFRLSVEVKKQAKDHDNVYPAIFTVSYKTVLSNKLLLPKPDQALPGRQQTIFLENRHYLSGRPIIPPYSQSGEEYQQVLFGMGCFWGAERKFWTLDGVFTTAVGYAAGYTPNPTYEEVCSGLTGHTEVVLVVYQEQQISFQLLLQTFFESHNPTQGMRQGNDQGTQYRSGIYCYSQQQQQQASQALKQYQLSLSDAGHPEITTEVLPVSEFYYAEQYHQQYLAKNPNGYCGLNGTGISCAI